MMQELVNQYHFLHNYIRFKTLFYNDDNKYKTKTKRLLHQLTKDKTKATVIFLCHSTGRISDDLPSFSLLIKNGLTLNDKKCPTPSIIGKDIK